MNPQVEKLESLLARVQQNRKLPRPVVQVAPSEPVVVAAKAPLAPASARPAPAPVLATKALEPVAAPVASAPVTSAPVTSAPAPAPAPVASPAPVVPAPVVPTLDAVVEDAHIVEPVAAAPRVEASIPAPPVVAAPAAVLDLVDDVSVVDDAVIVDVDDEADLAPPAASKAAEPVAAAPVRPRAVSQSMLAVAVQEQIEPLAEAPAAAAGPVPMVAEPHATASGPIIKVTTVEQPLLAPTFGELVRRSLALRPR